MLKRLGYEKIDPQLYVGGGRFLNDAERQRLKGELLPLDPSDIQGTVDDSDLDEILGFSPYDYDPSYREGYDAGRETAKEELREIMQEVMEEEGK